MKEDITEKIEKLGDSSLDEAMLLETAERAAVERNMKNKLEEYIQKTKSNIEDVRNGRYHAKLGLDHVKISEKPILIAKIQILFNRANVLLKQLTKRRSFKMKRRMSRRN